MDEKTKRLIEASIKLVQVHLDKANGSESQFVVNGALMAAISHLTDVVVKQQAVIEAQQKQLEELNNQHWEHVNDVSLHVSSGYDYR